MTNAAIDIPRRADGVTVVPLLPRQQRWLNMDSIYPGAASPQVSMTYRLRGPLVVDAWVRALGAVADRHETLRARFVRGAGGDVQVIEPPRGLAVERIDLGALPSDERLARARELLEERRAVRFDLEHGPPVVSALIRLADDDHVWALTIHHISADGQSLAVIARELAVLYRAFAAGTVPELPEPVVRAGDYAVWCAANADDGAAHRAFWLRQLAGVPDLDLRTDLPRPPTKGAAAAYVYQEFGHELAERVAAAATATRGTRFIVALTALQLVLGRWSGQAGFCVGVAVSGSERYRPELADMVAPFNTVLALRCDLSDGPSFAELARRNRGTLMSALAHQEFRYAQVIAALDRPADPSRAQLCQVLFNFDESTGALLDLPGLTVESVPMAIPKMPYDLLVHAGMHAGGMWTRFNYDTGLFTEDTVAGWVREFGRTLRTAAG